MADIAVVFQQNQRCIWQRLLTGLDITSFRARRFRIANHSLVFKTPPEIVGNPLLRPDSWYEFQPLGSLLFLHFSSSSSPFFSLVPSEQITELQPPILALILSRKKKLLWSLAFDFDVKVNYWRLLDELCACKLMSAAKDSKSFQFWLAVMQHSSWC